MSHFCQVQDNLLDKASKAIELTTLHKSIFKKLSEVNNEFKRISTILNNPDIQDSPEAGDARSRINDVMAKNGQYEAFREWLTETAELLTMKDDPSMAELVEEEKAALEERLQEIIDEALKELITKDKYDDCTVSVVEFRPGVGGGESMIFAEEMVETYKSYCTTQGWRVETLNYNADTSIGKGIKSATLRITGQDSYAKLKCESGVHK
jgi:peptide chain release factor 1